MLATISPKSLFLIDSLGALSSVISGLVLAQFATFFGLTANLFYLLSGVAVFYCIFSNLCFWQVVENERWGLKTIAIANFSYCGLSALIAVYAHKDINIWGIFYFIIEILIIASLAAVEWNKANKMNPL